MSSSGRKHLPPFPHGRLRGRSRSMLLVVLTLSFCFQPFCFQPICAAQELESNACTPVTLESVLKKYRQRGEEKWEAKISELESRRLRQGPGPADALLFFGSSSFRRWDTVSTDMAPYPTINCGYGGAKFVDMVLFAERILTPHQYRALMLFAGNDVKGETADSSPEEVASVVREIIRVSKSHLPNAPVFIIEVTPTESRFAAWDKTRKINAALREVALTTDNTWCITTAEHYLNADGTPKKAYFVDDKLHLNEQGYQKWAELIKEQLDTFITVEETSRN